MIYYQHYDDEYEHYDGMITNTRRFFDVSEKNVSEN